MLKQLTGSDIKQKAESPDVADVAKTPWKFYGKIIKVQGEVNMAQDYPPGSNTAEALGGNEAGELGLITEDSEIVYYFHTDSTGDVKVGDNVTVYGYPVGQAEIILLGTPRTELVIVGKTIERLPR